MNTRRTPTRKDEGQVANERIPLRNAKVKVVYHEALNESVSPLVLQGPQVAQLPQIPQGPQPSYVERDMTIEEIRAVLRALTQLITTQAHVVTNHVDAQAIIGV